MDSNQKPTTVSDILQKMRSEKAVPKTPTVGSATSSQNNYTVGDILKKIEAEKRETTRLENNRQFQSEINRLQSTEDLQSRPEQAQRVLLPRVANWRDETRKDFAALASGEVSVGDVAREVPAQFEKTMDAIGNTFLPGAYNFTKASAGILFEGFAFAVNKEARERYLAGELDIFPTITNTSQKELVRWTVAAGIEASLLKAMPFLKQKATFRNAGIGALEGVGFAVAAGIAQDKSPEEIVDTLPEYGVSGAVLSVVAPYLIPILRAEGTELPGVARQMFKELYGDVKVSGRNVPENLAQLRDDVYVKLATRNGEKISIPVTQVRGGGTKIPVRTTNEAYESFLRQNGYDPVYVPDGELPSFDVGEPAPRERLDGMLDADTMAPPNVSSPDYMYGEEYLRPDQMPTIDFGEPASTRRLNGMLDADTINPPTVSSPEYPYGEAYLRDEEMPVISFDGRTPERRGPLPKVDSRDIKIEPIPQTQKEKVTPVTRETKAQGKTRADNTRVVPLKDVEKTSAPRETGRLVQTEQQVESRTVNMGGRSRTAPSRPVGDGEMYVSRLAKRMSEELSSLTDEQRQMLGGIGYNRANLGRQMQEAVRLIEEDFDRAMRIATGVEDSNEVLTNAVVMALARHAEETGDASLLIQVAKLSSLRATRAGQELSALRMLSNDYDDPAVAIEKIIDARRLEAARRNGGGNSSVKTQKEIFKESQEKVIKEVNSVLTNNRLKIAEAQKAIDDIIC